MTHQRCEDGSLGRRTAGFTHSAKTAGVIALLVLSCGDGAVGPPRPPVATTVTVNPGSASFTALGETARFTAEVRDQNGEVMAGAVVVWASSDASVATVDGSGLVTAAGNGTATITATAGSAAGTASVIVFSEPEIYNGNLFVLPVDENLATGEWSLLDGTRQFYEHFDDDFDFLVFVVNLYPGDDPSGRSYFTSTRNDVRGIGHPISSDNRWPAALQGVVVHGIVSFSVDRRSIIHTGPMLHELMHKWANFVTPSSGSGPHWGFSSANGTLGGFDISDLADHGGGRYSAGDFSTHGVAANNKPYSPLELYLAGFLPPEEVPDLWVAEDGQWVDEASGNQMFTASRVRTYSIEDIVGMQGLRVPNHTQSQREFRAATILLVDDHHPITSRNLNQLSDDISWFSRTAGDGDDRVYNFFEATGGRAMIDMNDLSRSASQRANVPPSCTSNDTPPWAPGFVWRKH